MSKLNVLLTGPSGRVGPHLLPDFESRYNLRTFDINPSHRPDSFVGDMQSVDALREAMRGIDVVMHLAATSDEAPFLEELVPNNIEGLYNVMTAAHLEGVRRVVFTSSVQAVGYKLKTAKQPVETETYAPSSLYGATKVFGEVLGQWYHHHKDMEFVAIRVGWFQPYDGLEDNGWLNDIWLSPRDCVSLFQCAIETPNVGYAIVNGTSKSPREVLSLKSAREILGYEPYDDWREILKLRETRNE